MFTSNEREDIKTKLVNYLSKYNNVQSICLVGSNATSKADIYSDLDFSIIVKEDCVKELWEEFYNILHDEQIFRKFKVDFGNDEYLVGLFLNNGLELDIGFTIADSFADKNSHKPNLKYKVLYEKDGFETPKVVNNAKFNGLKILEKANNDIWYNFKNAIFALKRNNLFRCLNEVEESRNYLISIIASLNNLESKHFKQIDRLSDYYKKLIMRTYPCKITYKQLKRSLLNVMNLFYIVLRENGLNTEAEEYKQLFTELMKEVKL